MTNTIIRVENLGKKYIIDHQQQERYSTLRDAIANRARAFTQKPLQYFAKNNAQSGREEFWALKDVSFEIKQGDRVGIIGRNGAGKSTLLKVLSRITEPTTGRIYINGRVACLLEVGTGFHPELTGRENIYLNGAILGMSRFEIKNKFDEIVAFAEVERFLDTPVKRYSSGMYVRLAFSVAAHLEPEILIVDEVLAVGDVAFQKKCLGKMEDVSKEGRTVIFVSHNLATVKQLCTKAIMLECGSIHTHGSIVDAINEYKRKIFYIQGSTSNAPGVLFIKSFDEAELELDYSIRKIEILDQEENLKSSLATWDYVKFRIHYFANKNVNNGSGVLWVMTHENTKLILCSNMPDKTVPMKISKGEHYFDCCFESWPLASGQYLLNAALAIPMREWLCQLKEPVSFSTESKDIFKSGLPPESSRYIFAVPYEITSGS